VRRIATAGYKAIKMRVLVVIGDKTGDNQEFRV
jgi:hypothetical protein